MLNILAEIGDFLSGFCSLAAFVVAVLAIKRTIPNEMEKLRQTKRAERRAEVAETVWGDAYRLIVALRGFTDACYMGRNILEISDEELLEHPKLGDLYLSERKDLRKEVHERANALLEVWPLARLHLSQAVNEALGRLWALRGQLLTDERMHAHGLNRSSADAATEKSIHSLHNLGPQKIDQCAQELEGLLGPIALHEPEQNLVVTSGASVLPPPAKATGE
ncbi:hypothetical protein POL68_36490 [Stigmatella sp. ncwal1]|uniref:Uncharacterized protein n=1 Tax=Stigmatella ashevillensis TaxID=2995309 RepID=A0ABT5DK46_9BACT|nr:hypothetical protein [Stigmatella ashevillena]MDC0714022.1 hypothetical protein [Stigmatella ashevillena]